MDQQVKNIIDAMEVYKGRNMRFVIYPAFEGDQRNKQKLVVTGVVKEIGETNGGWGKAAQVVFEGGSTFMFQSYQTIWVIGNVEPDQGSLKGYDEINHQRSEYFVSVEIGRAW